MKDNKGKLRILRQPKKMNLFQEAVYRAVKKVPRGKVSTYKNIAHLIQRPNAYRAVGRALHKNTSQDVPCHRIIKADGQVGGYRADTQRKIQKLRQEGVIIQSGKVNLKKFLWP